MTLPLMSVTLSRLSLIRTAFTWGPTLEDISKRLRKSEPPGRVGKACAEVIRSTVTPNFPTNSSGSLAGGSRLEPEDGGSRMTKRSLFVGSRQPTPQLLLLGHIGITQLSLSVIPLRSSES